MDHTHSNPASADPGCLSPLELAAFIDDELAPERREAVEAHLARCRECLAAVAGVRMVVAEPLPAVPPEVLAAAKDLVRQPTPSLGSTDPGWWRGRGALVFGRWAAGLAAAVAVCIAGYHVGATIPSGGATTDLTAELSFGMFDAEPDELEFSLFAMGGAMGGNGATGGRP